jgi:hypothetical protein
MGAGCYYTHKETGTRAVWIDLDYSPETDDDGEEVDKEFMWDDEVEFLGSAIEELGYEQESNYVFRNGLFNIELESGYGGEIIIRLEPRYSEGSEYQLAMANHERSYDRIKRHLLKRGYELRIATSGYTSCKVTM